MVIKEFKGKYAFLSNFFDSPIKIEGTTYKTVEHWFQSQKSKNSEEQEFIRQAKTPSEAKKKGKTVSLRSDWETIKLEIMEKGLREKFQQNPQLAEKLLQTKNEILEEGNKWKDTFWGIDLKNSLGENHLGKLLMKIRADLKKRNTTKNIVKYQFKQ